MRESTNNFDYLLNPLIFIKRIQRANVRVSSFVFVSINVLVITWLHGWSLVNVDISKQPSKSRMTLITIWILIGSKSKHERPPTVPAVHDVLRRPYCPPPCLALSVRAVTFTYGCTHSIGWLVHVRQPLSRKTTCLLTLYAHDSLRFSTFYPRIRISRPLMLQFRNFAEN